MIIYGGRVKNGGVQTGRRVTSSGGESYKRESSVVSVSFLKKKIDHANSLLGLNNIQKHFLAQSLIYT
jgi:hypothetical protein